jgi:hypothetical protein
MRIIDVTDGVVTSGVVTMRRRDTPLQFVLYPMMHVAQPSFYAEIHERLMGCELIVAEGIRGWSPQLSALTLAYRFAPRFRRRGLCEQNYATLLPAGVPVINPDLTSAEFVTGLRRLPRWEYRLLLTAAPVFGLVFAVSGPRAFLTRHLTVDLSTTLRPEVLRAEMIRDKNRRAGITVDHPFDAISVRREDLLLDALTVIHTERCQEPITVAVVYGAAHMPAVATGLMVRHGYRVRDVERLVIFAAAER